VSRKLEIFSEPPNERLKQTWDGKMSILYSVKSTRPPLDLDSAVDLYRKVEIQKLIFADV